MDVAGVLVCLLASAIPLGIANAFDASTLRGKLIMGYQGWFACPGDQAGRGWVHWYAAQQPTVDLLPDVTDLLPAARCATAMKTADGQDVQLFTSQDESAVMTHFAWMAQYGLDGVAFQRFATGLSHPEVKRASDNVLANVQKAAEHYGRVFFVMYDLSGLPPDQLPLVVQDWQRLQAQGLTKSAAYLHHRGQPVVGIWGLGFKGRPMTPADALGLLADVHKSGATVLGGVPAGWRTGTGDASDDAGWKAVWPKLDVISPWTVGRYANIAGADAYKTQSIVPDRAAATAMGADFMPVVFPGFSWANLMHARSAAAASTFNQIPRLCGRFYWRQVFNAVTSRFIHDIRRDVRRGGRRNGYVQARAFRCAISKQPALRHTRR